MINFFLQNFHDKKFSCKHMKGPIGNTTKQATRDEKKRNGEQDKKKEDECNANLGNEMN